MMIASPPSSGAAAAQRIGGKPPLTAAMRRHQHSSAMHVRKREMNQAGPRCQFGKFTDPAQVGGTPQGQNADAQLLRLFNGPPCGLPADILPEAVMAIRHQDGSVLKQDFQFSLRIDPAPGQPVYIWDDADDPVGIVSLQIAQDERSGHLLSDCTPHIMGLENTVDEWDQQLGVDSRHA